MTKPSNSLAHRGRITWPIFALCFGCTIFLARLCAQGLAPSARDAVEQPLVDAAHNTLAWTFARLIEDAIPDHYDKKKDWGKTRNITVGLDVDGVKIRRRKKPVNHGVWKHYRINMVDPDQNLRVRIDNLHAHDGGRVGFTLLLSAKLDLWARAKVYQYGVHLIALEAVGHTAVDLALDCEVGVELKTSEGKTRVAVDPQVTDARLALRDFRLDRLSDAKGPLVEELGDEVKKLVEAELRGPKLTAKLNRAIDKKRDRLEFSLPGLVNSSWWPLAELPAVDQAIQQEEVLTR